MKWNTNPVRRKRDSTCSKKIRFRARANTHTHTGYNETKTRFPSSSSSVHGISYQGLKLTNPILSRWLWWWIKQDGNAKEIIPTRFLPPLSLSLSLSRSIFLLFVFLSLPVSYISLHSNFLIAESKEELFPSWQAFWSRRSNGKEEIEERGREEGDGILSELWIMELTGLQVASLWTL